jgi:DNA repair protein RadC
MKRKNEEFELKDSYFDGFEYKGYRVSTKLVVEGLDEYKPLRLSCATDVYNAFRHLHESDREKFYAVHLDGKNKVIGVDLVSQGTLDCAPVHPREIFKSAFLNSACSLIFVHAHPSGDPEPSTGDRELTEQLERIADIMGIDVLDHVIIGREGYYSFSDQGELWKERTNFRTRLGSG